MSESIAARVNPPPRGRAKLPPAQAIVSAAELPQAVSALILRVVSKTRLWKRERSEVAAELVSHFKGGLDAGRSANDLVETFGNPAVAARLIRRAKRRNRPLWWRAGARIVRGVLILAILWTCAALLLLTQRPHMRVNYVAEYNNRFPSVPAEQQAWPIYRAALQSDSIEALSEDLAAQTTDHVDNTTGPTRSDLRPTDAEWPLAVALLEKHGVLLRAAREGGRKDAYGLPLLPAEDYAAADRVALGYVQYEQPSGTPLSALRWNELNHPLSMMAYLLALDAWHAASEGDTDRAAEDLHAMLGMARQAHRRSTFLAWQVALGTAHLASRTIAEVDLAYPGLLDGRRRVALLHDMAATSHVFDADLSGERLMLLDLIQRTYSDDGEGGGLMTFAGIRYLTSGADSVPGRPSYRREPTWDENALMFASLPALALLGAPRSDATDKVNQFFNAAERDFAEPMWQRLSHTSETRRLTDAWMDGFLRYRHLVLSMFLWQVESTALWRDVTRGAFEATMTGLSLGVWREQRGDYPASLAELVPRYLPQIPIDHSSGHPLRYKLRDDGKPLLYGVGENQSDEGGVWIEEQRVWPNLPAHGDWVVYPPVEERSS